MTHSPRHEVVILIDDAQHAQGHLAPLLARLRGRACTLIACAPRMTHRVSKWVSHAAREHWRNKWASKQFAVLEPWMVERGIAPLTLLAKGPVTELLETMQPEHLVDARRPKQPTGAGPTSAERYEARHGSGDAGAAQDPPPPGRRRGYAFDVLLPLMGTLALLSE